MSTPTTGRETGRADLAARLDGRLRARSIVVHQYSSALLPRVQSIRASLSRFHRYASVPQRLPQLVEPAQKDGLPRIPGEQAKDEPATRAADLHRNEHEGVEKRSGV